MDPVFSSGAAASLSPNAAVPALSPAFSAAGPSSAAEKPPSSLTFTTGAPLPPLTTPPQQPFFRTPGFGLIPHHHFLQATGAELTHPPSLSLGSAAAAGVNPSLSSVAMETALDPPLATDVASVASEGNRLSYANALAGGNKLSPDGMRFSTTTHQPPPRPTPPRSLLSFTVASSAQRISKDNGVCIRAFSGHATVNDYAAALVASGIPAQQLSDLSRVGGTVQAYFKDSSWVLQLIQTGLDFRDEHLEVLPIGVAPRPITVSDVPPWVPDYVVKAVLNRYGIVQGQVRALPVSLTLPGVGYVRSNRRVADVVFASPADFSALPKRETIHVNGESIVLAFNVPIKCRKCGSLGHLAKLCPQLQLSTEHISHTLRDNALVVPTPSAEDRPEAATIVERSSEAMETEVDFTVVSGRRKRDTSKRPSMAPPAAVPKRSNRSRASKYLFDTVHNQWRDVKGEFPPLVDHASVASFTAEALSKDAPEALLLAAEFARDGASLATLARQVMVFAYTNSDIAQLATAEARKHTIRRYYLLARTLRQACGSVSESEGYDTSTQ